MTVDIDRSYICHNNNLTYFNDHVQPQLNMFILLPSLRIIRQNFHIQGGPTSSRVEQQFLLHGFPAARPALILLPELNLGPGVRYLLHPDRIGHLGEDVHPFVAQRVEVLAVPRYLRPEFDLEILILRPFRLYDVVFALGAQQDFVKVDCCLFFSSHLVQRAERTEVSTTAGMEPRRNFVFIVA